MKALGEARAGRSVDEAPRTAALPDASLAPVVESAYARAFVLGARAAAPEGTAVTFLLPSSARFAYTPRSPSVAPPVEVAPDPFVRGNAFTPLHQGDRALVALLSIAAGRRLETGPESERLLVVLRGRGLVFLENGDTLPFDANHLAFIPAGEPARVWAQGPEDVLAVVMQPNVAPVKRRTLADEIAKRRGGA